MNHTPGPWEARGEEVYAKTSDGLLELRIATGIAGHNNARLIASTPALKRENKQLAATIDSQQVWNNKLRLINAELLEALEAIQSYERPHHSPGDEDIASWQACENCKATIEKKWPPSRKCDEHYRKIISKPRRENEHENIRTQYVLKDIAREAIAKANES